MMLVRMAVAVNVEDVSENFPTTVALAWNQTACSKIGWD